MWTLLLLYFRAAHRTKYALEALTLLVQVQALFPPRLAHQVKWNVTTLITAQMLLLLQYTTLHRMPPRMKKFLYIPCTSNAKYSSGKGFTQLQNSRKFLDITFLGLTNPN